jgi:hypothetical protein
MTYRELIDAAKLVPPGDTRAANRWLLDLAAVLAAGELMPAQRSYLYRLRRVWRHRAMGQDARWNVFGSVAGAKPSTPPVVKPAPTPSAPQPVSVKPAPVPVLVRPAAPKPAAPPASAKPLSSLLEKYHQ